MTNETPTIQITSFGGFSVSLRDDGQNGTPGAAVSDKKGHSKKVWTLLEYLLLSGKEAAHSSELIDILWPEGDAQDPRASLRMVVHRARAELDKLGAYKGSQLIVYRDDRYSFNRSVPLEVDTERFEALLQAAQTGSLSRRLNLLLEAEALYKGRFLPKSTHMQWAMVLDTYYQSKYTALCLEAVGLLKTLGRNWDIVELCKKAVVFDPFGEDLQAAFLEALTAVGAYTTAQEHYRRFSDDLMREFGILPSEKLTAAYHALMKSSNDTAADIGEIRQGLAEKPKAAVPETGAFFCEYELFKQIYHLKSRECRRSGQMIQLALITVLPAGGKTPGSRSKSNAVKRLNDTLCASLRQSDIFTRYSTAQYLVLLQSASYENGARVLERIMKRFKASASGSGFLLQYNLLPLLPSGFDEFQPK